MKCIITLSIVRSWSSRKALTKQLTIRWKRDSKGHNLIRNNLVGVCQSPQKKTEPTIVHRNGMNRRSSRSCMLVIHSFGAAKITSINLLMKSSCKWTLISCVDDAVTKNMIFVEWELVLYSSIRPHSMSRFPRPGSQKSHFSRHIPRSAKTVLSRLNHKNTPRWV